MESNDDHPNDETVWRLFVSADVGGRITPASSTCQSSAAEPIEIRQDVPIYELSTLNRTFDIILCLGVFYHLRDPFYGFAQMRHCCHPETRVVVEGELAWTGTYPNEVRYFYNNWLEFLPSPSALAGLLKSAVLPHRLPSLASSVSDHTLRTRSRCSRIAR